MRELFGILSGVLPIIGAYPYIRDILKHKTKPHRTSFLIWVVLDATAFASQLAKGATWSLIMPAIGTIEVLTSFILSLKYGVGGFAKKDIVALLLAGFGLILWYFTKEPLTALLIVIAIDVVGISLTILKTYEHPHTETFSTWLLSSIAGLFAAAAVGHLSFALLVYPLYISIANAGVCAAILLGRRKMSTRSHSAKIG